jgi:hypothetical protein
MLAEGVVPDIDSIVSIRLGQHKCFDGIGDDRYIQAVMIKIGEKNLDACVLRLNLSSPLPDGCCAFWREGRIFERFYGLGMSKKFLDGLALSGTLQAPDEDPRLQLITAEHDDNRVEQGSSGAPIFAEGDGPLVGMVAKLQQSASGKIIRAKALNELWPALKAQGADAIENPPSLSEAPIEISKFKSMIGEVDRTKQIQKFNTFIEDRSLMAQSGQGIVISVIRGSDDDLPSECASRLSRSAFREHLKYISCDAKKSSMPYVFGFTELVDSDDYEESLISQLSESLACSANEKAVAAALAERIVPTTIIIRARPSEIQYAKIIEVLSAWARALVKITRPEKLQPVALFLLVSSARDDDNSIINFNAPPNLTKWLVDLDPLPEVNFSDVEIWAFKKFKDESDYEVVTNYVARKAAGRSKFRLKELRDWIG